MSRLDFKTIEEAANQSTTDWRGRKCRVTIPVEGASPEIIDGVIKAHRMTLPVDTSKGWQWEFLVAESSGRWLWWPDSQVDAFIGGV